MNVPAADLKLVIVGASEMVGGYALRYALDHTERDYIEPLRNVDRKLWTVRIFQH
jgi:hypothetical protein